MTETSKAVEGETLAGQSSPPHQVMLATEDPEFAAAVQEIESTVFGGDRALGEKVSRLVHVACSCVRGGSTVPFAIRGAMDAGASRKEILETIEICILTAGGQAVRHGIDALESLGQSEERGGRG